MKLFYQISLSDGYYDIQDMCDLHVRNVNIP